MLAGNCNQRTSTQASGYELLRANQDIGKPLVFKTQKIIGQTLTKSTTSLNTREKHCNLTRSLSADKWRVFNLLEFFLIDNDNTECANAENSCEVSELFFKHSRHPSNYLVVVISFQPVTILSTTVFASVIDICAFAIAVVMS